MELPVSTNVSTKRGHRCGACHNASNAKVRTAKQFTKLGNNWDFLRVSVCIPCVANVRALYICDLDC